MLRIPTSLLCFAALVLVHIVLYGGVLRIGFVTDDFLWLADAGRDVGLVEHAISREPFGYFRPLFHLLLVASRTVFGLDALPLHVLALLTGSLASTLLAVLLWRITGDRPAAFVGTALFVLHPSHAIVLAWISSLPSLLATAGVLGSAIAWHAYRRGGRLRLAMLSLLLHGFALLAKEEAAITVAWFVAIEILGRHSGALRRANRTVHGLFCAQLAVLAIYLAFWSSLGQSGAPYRPETIADWLRACLDPLIRAAALFLPRDLVRWPVAEVLLVAAIVVGMRRSRDGRPGQRHGWCVGLLLVLLALLPSSMFLWHFPYDKLGRLLQAALPAAALTCAFAVLTWRRSQALAASRWRVGGAAWLLLTLVPFAIRSMKTIHRRQHDGAVAEQLFAALRQHEALLLELARKGATLTIRGYDSDWVYPVAPARALAPTLDVRLAGATDDAATTILEWLPERSAFVVRHGTARHR